LRVVVQRVTRAEVRPGGAIGSGLLALVGVAETDTETEADRLAGRVAGLRVFEGADGKFDRSLLDSGGSALVVSQFTLVADTRKGNRPSFSAAARPEQAEPLYERFCERLSARRGVFGALMAVELTNDGPVTLLVESR
jgi:D-aminoacyl-tRNA deacylase